MAEFAKEIIQINLEDEMKQSYLDYAMSVIVGRALPDVRDGLKPVHRRVLYAMSELNNDWNKPFKKSARIVGDVIGKYHPHGDTAVYDTIVRMAQPFSLRYMLVDGQGNFGSVDGDAAAAMRYTEVRMAKIAHQLIADIDKETVDFVANYDESEREPAVFPTRVPNLLVNGSAGIAVGMATNIPPHNLTEVINGCLKLIEVPETSIDELMEVIPAPDLPTAGIINGTTGIREAYHTGRGRMFMRARAEVEVDEKSGREKIIVTELPYQVNKARLLEKIAELVKEKKIEGISELRDESDKDGMRMVIETKRGESAEVLLNNLYKQTQLQTVFGINMVALVDGQPRLLNLKDILNAFIRHRKEVVTRRTVFELRKARNSAHVFEGLAVALANIDEIIELIKKSSGPAEAKQAMMAKGWNPGIVISMLERAGADNARPEGLPIEFGLRDGQYHLTETQAQAILDLKLQRLTGLEQDKITNDYKELIELIEGLLAILGSTERLLEVIVEELVAIRDEFGDERRSEIFASRIDLNPEDFVTDEAVVVTFTHSGYAKTQQLSDYRAQRRGGRGKSATAMKDEDFVDQLFIANTHDTLLCFSSRGKAYWLKVYNIPVGSRASKGRPIVNLLPLEENERITAVLPVREYADDQFVFMATKSGTVKKTPLSAFSRPRTNGIIAVDLRDDDCLVNVGRTDGTRDVMLVTNAGKAIRFNESDVRAMGRTATGVRGIKMQKGQEVIGLMILEEGQILLATQNGYGKRTPVDEFSTQGRGGQGVIAIQTSERNGSVVGACQVLDEHQIMLITDGGTLVRTRVSEVSSLSRNTQGVTLIRLSEGENLVGIDKVVDEDSEDEELDGEMNALESEGSADVSSNDEVADDEGNAPDSPIED